MSKPSSLFPILHHAAPSPRRGRWATAGTWVNDIHSQLNPTRVHRLVAPRSQEEVQEVVTEAGREGRAVCIAGGRHAMGGQQFASGATLLDTRRLTRVQDLDTERGTVRAEAGIQWPELMRYLLHAQRGHPAAWGIRQKQTGADRLSLGGAVAANIHGRGLRMRPFIGDVESLVLVDAEGRARRCSRTENPELFRLVCGGYGLFGVVTSVTLRLARRRKLQRVVEVCGVEGLIAALEQRIADGYEFGDFQFATDSRSDEFLNRGVLSAYRPVDPGTPVAADQRELSEADWRSLLHLAHADKSEAFRRYAAHYLATSGQIYWSDTHQLTTYLDGYHGELDRSAGSAHPRSEVITEIYVPRHRLADFLADVREDFRTHGTELIYGTVRLVERDSESFLAWARQPFACVVFNLCVSHTPEGARRAGDAFRRLIDHAIARGGSYYLTYHRHATREQVLACYPQLPEFLRRKREHDPAERFQSEWYRWYRRMLTGEQGGGAA